MKSCLTRLAEASSTERQISDEKNKDNPPWPSDLSTIHLSPSPKHLPCDGQGCPHRFLNHLLDQAFHRLALKPCD